jgi:predicted ArsR family transcriptional regulator
MQLAELLNGTRGEIVALVRSGISTVAEIALALNVTENNVRIHLTRLERDGIVAASGFRTGIRKPSRLYTLTPQAESIYATAYEPVMLEFVEVLASSGSPLQPAFAEVGRRLAASLGPLEGASISERLAAVAATLRRLGGTPIVQIEGDTALVQSRQCPLSKLVEKCPDSCAIGQAMISAATGLTVEEVCTKTGKPSCAFRVHLAA